MKKSDRKNGQEITVRNPRAGGRPRLHAGHRRDTVRACRARFLLTRKRVETFLEAEELQWLDNYGREHRLRGRATVLRQLVVAAMSRKKIGAP